MDGLFVSSDGTRKCRESQLGDWQVFRVLPSPSEVSHRRVLVCDSGNVACPPRGSSFSSPYRLFDTSKTPP